MSSAPQLSIWPKELNHVIAALVPDTLAAPTLKTSMSAGSKRRAMGTPMSVLRAAVDLSAAEIPIFDAFRHDVMGQPFWIFSTDGEPQLVAFVGAQRDAVRSFGGAGMAEQHRQVDLVLRQIDHRGVFNPPARR